MGTPLLEAREVTMGYRVGGANLLALQRVSLHVDNGEFAALVGPSGSGKTTLLSIFAGLETPTSGAVALRGDTHARLLGQAGYMPQRDLLLPWRSALSNAIAGLQAQGVSRSEATTRARAIFAEFGLAGFERAWPATLSGGMRQRVAFARTVLAAHDLLLLDEPFGALDALTRTGLQRWLANLWERLGATCLLVTHDLDEALLLADRIYVLSPRPGTVRLERAVPLERPRRLEMLARPGIVAIKAELLASLLDAETGAMTGGAA
jgi:ABC-type nitrate/sulfonate/bicarbonate transport system ATPase subunit